MYCWSFVSLFDLSGIECCMPSFICWFLSNEFLLYLAFLVQLEEAYRSSNSWIWSFLLPRRINCFYHQSRQWWLTWSFPLKNLAPFWHLLFRPFRKQSHKSFWSCRWFIIYHINTIIDLFLTIDFIQYLSIFFSSTIWYFI